MSTPYKCPSCKTNRSRFNIIDQVVHSVKLDPQSGEVVQEYNQEELVPFHQPYTGPEQRVQCAVCGLVEDEIRFIKFAEQ